MSERYDVAVVGLGSMGSAVAAQLAKRGKRVIGFERFEFGHAEGSSSGKTRIIRKAYFEGPAYVPLLERAYELWRALERECDVALLDLIGLLMVGTAGGDIVEAVARTSARFGVRVDVLDGAEVARRFPQVRVLPGEVALFEPEAGVVFPETCVAALTRLAMAHGAALRDRTRVLAWSRESDGWIRIELESGEVVRVERLALCAGPWSAQLMGDANVPLHIQRNVQVWFDAPALPRGSFPAFFLDRAGLPEPLYGFPDYGEGLKAALHAYGPPCTPASLDRAIHAADVAAVRDALEDFMPGAIGAFRFGKACMYALTPDHDFIVDRFAGDDGVVIAAGFSGHGFKFVPVIGEIVADMLYGRTRHDVAFLSLARFGCNDTPPV